MPERVTIPLKRGVSLTFVDGIAFLRIAGNEYKQLGHLYTRRDSIPLLVEQALMEVDLETLNGYDSIKADLLALRALTEQDSDLTSLCQAIEAAQVAISCSRANLRDGYPKLGDLPAIWLIEAFTEIEKAKEITAICLPTGPSLAQLDFVESVRVLLPPQTKEYAACQLRLKGRRWPRTERALLPLSDYLDERCVLFLVSGRDYSHEVLELCAQQFNRLMAPLIIRLGRELPELSGQLRFDLTGDAAIVLLNPKLATTSPVVTLPCKVISPYRQLTV